MNSFLYETGSPTIFEKYLSSSDVNITSPPWRLISWAIVGSLSPYLNGQPCQDNIITGTVLQSSQKTLGKTHDSCPLFQISYFYMFQSASMIFTNYHSWGSSVSVSHQFLKHFFTNLGVSEPEESGPNPGEPATSPSIPSPRSWKDVSQRLQTNVQNSLIQKGPYATHNQHLKGGEKGEANPFESAVKGEGHG